MANWTYISDLDAFELYHKAQEQEEPSSAGALFLAFLPALKQALAGATGSAVSNIVVYPLDLVVTRLKVQQRLEEKGSSDQDHDTHYSGISDAVTKIYKHEGGVSAFYGGIIQDTAKTVADSFFFFLAYNVLRKSRKRWPASRYTVLQILDSLSIGMAAGAFSKLLTTPIQIVVIRKQTATVASASKARDKKPRTLGRELSVRQIIDEVYRERGLSGFWAGYSATLFLTMNPAITFFCDSFFRRTFNISKHPSPSTTFLLAAVGKSTASALLYPLSLAKSRAQVSTASSKEVGNVDDKTSGAGFTKHARKSMRRANVISTITEIARTEGFTSLYAGLGGEVLKGFFAHGITMLVKDRLYSLVIRLYYALAKLQTRARIRVP